MASGHPSRTRWCIPLRQLCKHAAPSGNSAPYGKRRRHLALRDRPHRGDPGWRRSPTMNADTMALKLQARAQWDRSARGWNDHTPQIGEWLRSATEAMLDMAAVQPGASVLDVAAGAGDRRLDIARRVGRTGRVLATDLSPSILAFAQLNADRAGLGNVATMVADGEELPVERGSFDCAVCRLGLMLFPN